LLAVVKLPIASLPLLPAAKAPDDGCFSSYKLVNEWDNSVSGNIFE
jgi:hypothetical protein